MAIKLAGGGVVVVVAAVAAVVGVGRGLVAAAAIYILVSS